MDFKIKRIDAASNARTGIIQTAHGKINTPIFMPVGTAGSVKGVHQHEIKEDTKAEIILGNTYHLYLRPGIDLIAKAGGLHKFIGWSYPILTDSGGYQVFSLASNRKLTPGGAIFRSHIDGSKHTFTPENIVDIQRTIGADIMMPLDECTPYPCSYKYAHDSLLLTNQWLERGLKRFKETSPKYDYHQDYFPIVQGSTYKDLRVKSAEFVATKECAGNAIGGLSVGEPAEEMYEMVEVVNAILPTEKPRYLMGVGTPVNILEAIERGIDMFDCVMPTRNGRNGMLFTSEGIINIKNEKWRNDLSPVDAKGTSFVDNAYSKAYLRHLIVSKEMLGAQIATLHNLAFYLWLVKKAALKIEEGTFTTWKSKMVKTLNERL